MLFLCVRDLDAVSFANPEVLRVLPRFRPFRGRNGLRGHNNSRLSGLPAAARPPPFLIISMAFSLAHTAMTASVSEITGAINSACQEKGGAYAQYSCCSVSWDDACRGTVGGSLSSIGPNITDSRCDESLGKNSDSQFSVGLKPGAVSRRRLWAKDGTLLYTVRTQNWCE